MRRLFKKQPSADCSTHAVRRASGWSSGLLLITLLTATVLSYGVWGLDMLTGAVMDGQLYQVLGGILPTILGALAAVLAARKITGCRLKDLLGRQQNSTQIVLLGFGLCMGLNIAASFFSDLMTKWLNQGGITVTPPDFSYSSQDPFYSGVLLFYACLIAPVLEELIFRGFILRLLLRFGSSFAILFSALLFALYHFDLTQLLPAFVMGILFGYIAVRCGSILPTISIHFLNNVVAVLLSTLSPVLSPTVLLIINVVLDAIAIISLLIALAIYRRDSGKLRLPVLEGAVPKGKAFGAACTSPIWILLILVYLYEVTAKIIML